MSDQVLTSYGANSVVLARATARPTSSTSGALGLPFSCFTASTSCWLVPSGSVELTVIPYFFSNVLMIVP